MLKSNGLPLPRLSIGITGHRSTNGSFANNRSAIGKALAEVFSIVETEVAAHSIELEPTRIHSLLAQGADIDAVEQALARGWQVVSPLPFGLPLALAIGCGAQDEAMARAIIENEPVEDAALGERLIHMRALAQATQLFELADQDASVSDLYFTTLANPADTIAASRFASLTSDRAAAAGRVMIEQSDMLIAIWDGVTPGTIGGTKHTIGAALESGTPVIRIDASDPTTICLLRGPEALDVPGKRCSHDDIATFVRAVVDADNHLLQEQARHFHEEIWHPRSARRFHAYRRIESLFGGSARGPLAGLMEVYETPETIASGTAQPLIETATSLPSLDTQYVTTLVEAIIARFAWADGVSTYLSDCYRGGMVMNFLLSATAIAAGVLYLPLASVDWKWPFAAAELAFLLSIVVITAVGRRRRWHGRWFETRRVAEYLRHAPVLLLLGVMRPTGRWPRGSKTIWPETYARNAMREVGLPAARITQAYLRDALTNVLGRFASQQLAYHRIKARRLTKVHHRLDKLSEWLFVLALLSVSVYLLLLALGAFNVIPSTIAHDASKSFTFLGIILPSLGGAFAGIRYFGDFERFAAISEVTAEKLEALDARIAMLAANPEVELRYAQVAALGHSLDDIVIDEIENWQAVFAAKNIAVPV